MHNALETDIAKVTPDMVRDSRLMAIEHQGFKRLIDMPGWYSDTASVHTPADMAIYRAEMAALREYAFMKRHFAGSAPCDPPEARAPWIGPGLQRNWAPLAA